MVRTSAAQRAVVTDRLTALGAVVVAADPPSAGQLSIPPPSFGITRRIGTPDRGQHLIRLPGAAVMPVLSERQLSDGMFPSDGLRGMIAVLAPPAELDPPRFRTSAIGGQVELGVAGYLARAHHALRTGRTAAEVDGWWRLILLATASIAMTLLVAGVRRGPAVPAFALAGLMIAVSVLAVSLAGLLLPATELVLLAGATGWLVGVRERAGRDRRAMLMVDRASAFLARNSLLADPSRWMQFLPSAARLAGADNSLLLEEKDEGGFDVHAAFGPQASQGAATLTRSEAFDRADLARPEPVPAEAVNGWPGARLVRLDAGADGGLYWLYSAERDGDTEAVHAAASRVAEVAAERAAFSNPARRMRQRDGVAARSFAALAALVTRAGELRHLLGALQTATILFDAAGIPLQVNQAMERLLRRVGLQSNRVTPVDVAASLASLDPESARDRLGELVRHGGDLRLNSQAEIGGRRYGVQVTEVGGNLLFEAIDVTELHRLGSLQTELAGEIDARIRNDLEAIELATRLATDERLTPERRNRALGMIGQATARTRGTLDKLARLVDASVFTAESEPYPVNLRSALIQGASTVKPLADQLGVHVELRHPAITSLVMADPDLLDALIKAMLEIPLSDSSRGADILAVLHETEESSELVVTGGFGLPAERFGTLLADQSRELAQPFRALQQAGACLPRWGAELDATSEAGRGYRFALRLKRS